LPRQCDCVVNRTQCRRRQSSLLMLMTPVLQSPQQSPHCGCLLFTTTCSTVALVTPINLVAAATTQQHQEVTSEGFFIGLCRMRIQDYSAEEQYLQRADGDAIWAICKSAPRSRQTTMPLPAPYHLVFLQAGCPSCHTTNSVKALKAKALKNCPL